MLSFKNIPLARFTEKLTSTFTLPKNKKVTAEPETVPFNDPMDRLYAGDKVYVYNYKIRDYELEKEEIIPETIFTRLSDYFDSLFDEQAELRRAYYKAEKKNSKVIRARANMSHLTPHQRKRVAQAKRNTRRNNLRRTSRR